MNKKNYIWKFDNNTGCVVKVSTSKKNQTKLKRSETNNTNNCDNKINNFNDRLTDITNSLKTVISKNDELTKKLESYENKIDDKISSISNKYNNNFKSITESIDDITDKLIGNNIDLDSIAESITKITDKLIGNNIDLDSIKEDYIKTSKNLDNIMDLINKNSNNNIENMDILRSDIFILQTSLNNVKDKLDDMDNKIKVNNLKVKKLTVGNRENNRTMKTDKDGLYTTKKINGREIRINMSV